MMVSTMDGLLDVWLEWQKNLEENAKKNIRIITQDAEALWVKNRAKLDSKRKAL